MANRYQPISHSMYIDLGGPMKFGLLGRTLGHSFSPRIHSALGNTNYKLFEREPSQLQEFFADPELKVMTYNRARLKFGKIYADVCKLGK